ncbi:MAG: two-component regulator propeller domain-containing protein [Bacteroidota bacterium]
MLFLQAGAQNTFDQNRLPLQHIKSGISQSSATQIIEDKFGFIWIGTPNGVNKYDGTDFQLFEKSIDGVTGLTDGYVEIMYEDTEGNLYIGTNQGLNIYDRKSNVIKPYPFKEQGRVIQSEYIGAIGRSDNLLWLGTDNGLYRYDMSSGEAKELEFEQIYREGPSNNYIVEVFTLANDRILVITQASFYILNKEMEVISESPKPLNISSAITVGDSVFWLGAHTGDLIRLKIKNQVSFDTLEVVTNPGHSILSLTLDIELG